MLLDWLLAGCRRRVADLLARNAVDAARRHWALTQDLPEMAGEIDEPLGADLAGRAARFRDDLATDYLLATREAMRYGDIPEGWRPTTPRACRSCRVCSASTATMSAC